MDGSCSSRSIVDHGKSQLGSKLKEESGTVNDIRKGNPKVGERWNR